jgi:chromatin-remodeling ATPase INO80
VEFNERRRVTVGKRLLFGELTPVTSSYFARSDRLPLVGRSLLPASEKFLENSLYPRGDMPSFIEIPDFSSLIADSSKLNYLDGLLAKLKKEDHRVLIFCQMTKMMDILEDYLMRKKYQYFRLDGSSNLADRRDMVHQFQTNDKIFAFLLSTRAGGLGVTLTAADTVIFYDNDWNPTMDAQATDRAHRIGSLNYFRHKFMCP